MLAIPQIGSSIESDNPGKIGIDASRSGNWRKGGLTQTEVFLCQYITQKYREKYNNPEFLKQIGKRTRRIA